MEGGREGRKVGRKGERREREKEGQGKGAVGKTERQKTVLWRGLICRHLDRVESHFGGSVTEEFHEVRQGT